MDLSPKADESALRLLPEPHPSPGREAYQHERELALAACEKRRENFRRFQASTRRKSKVDYLPIILDIENVSRCNFRCIMCMMESFPNGKRAEDLSLESFKKLIDDQYGLLEIKLHGIGEPLLQGDDYFEMVRYARERHIWVRTVTNASLLHVRNNYKKLIDSGIIEVQISIDGASAAVYEKIRVNGKFERVKANCKLINDYCREVGVTCTKMWTVVQRENIDDLERLVEFAAEVGFPQMVFSLQLFHWASEELREKLQNEMADATPHYDRLLRLVDYGEKLGTTVRFWNITRKYDASAPETRCPWPFERSFVASDMRTSPCSMIANPDLYEIGKTRDFSEVWLGTEYERFREMHISGDLPQVCRDCYIAK